MWQSSLAGSSTSWPDSTLSASFEPEGVAEDGSGEGGLLVVAFGAVDEGVVDFEDVDREFREGVRRRVARAEVVDRQQGAETIELVEPGDGRRGE